MIDRVQLISNQKTPITLLGEWTDNKNGKMIYLTLSLDENHQPIKKYTKAATISMRYTQDNRVSIYCNVAKTLFGTNLIDNAYYSFEDFVSKFDSIIGKHIEGINYRSMRINYLEYGVNLKTSQPPFEYTSLMREHCPNKLSHYKKTTYADSFSYHNRSNEAQFYDKKEELKTNASREISTKNLLRFELRMSKDSIMSKKFFDRELSLVELFTYDFQIEANQILLKWFEENILFHFNGISENDIDYTKIIQIAKDSGKVRPSNILLLISVMHASKRIPLSKIIEQTSHILSLLGHKFKAPSRSNYRKLLSNLPSSEKFELIHELYELLIDKINEKEYNFENRVSFSDSSSESNVVSIGSKEGIYV